MEKLNIRLEEEKDFRTTEFVTREAFWNVYKPGCDEHFVLHNFRDDDDYIKELSLVLEKDDQIIGHVMFAKAQIKADDGRQIPIVTFGPISILPEFKRQGFGKILLDYSLNKATEMGFGAVCMAGNIDFYGKSGFELAKTKHIFYHDMPREADCPFFLAKELKAGFLDGVVGEFCEPKGYFVAAEDVAEFDKQFPHKEKLKLPGQIFE